MASKQGSSSGSGDKSLQDKSLRIRARVEAYIKSLASKTSSGNEADNTGSEPEGAITDDICHCKFDCLAYFKVSQVLEHRKKMTEMEKSKREKYVMKGLQKIDREKTKSGKRKRDRYRYVFDGKPICKKVFCFLHNTGNKCLLNLQKHVKKNGIVDRVHGNKGRKPGNALKADKARYCVAWLERYAEVNGMPMPEVPREKDTEAPVMLPTHVTKKALHLQYKTSCTENNLIPLALTSFKNVWQHCASHIKMKPRDVDPNRKPRPKRKRKKPDGSATGNAEGGQKKKMKQEPIYTARKVESQMQAQQMQQPVPLPPMPTDLTMVQDGQRRDRLDYLQDMQGQQRLGGPMPTMSTGFSKDGQRREWQDYLNSMRKAEEEMQGQQRQPAPIQPMATDFTKDGQRREWQDYLSTMRKAGEEIQGQQRQPGPIPTMPIDFTKDGQRREWQEYLNTMRKAEEEMQGQQRQAGPIPNMPIDFTQVHYPFDCMQNVPHHSQQMGRSTIPHQSQQMGSCMMLPPENPRLSAPDWIRQNNTSTS